MSKRLSKNIYEPELLRLQRELVKLQSHVRNQRFSTVFDPVNPTHVSCSLKRTNSLRLDTCREVDLVQDVRPYVQAVSDPQ